MNPNTFSASSISVADLCMRRYAAEYITRGKGFENEAGLLGTALHNSLEVFVQGCYLDKNTEPSLKLLLDLFRMNFMALFDTADTDSQEYNDGMEMLHKWYARMDGYWDKHEVLTCEVKENFPIPTTIGEKPFTYIFDRCDRELEDGALRVVDYKSQRANVNSDGLKRHIQIRTYALAAAIKFKHINPPRIYVELHMLRHDSRIGIVFTREDNKRTWEFLRKRAQEIIDTNEADAQPRLNPQCQYCVAKQTCPALMANVSAGGIMSLGGAAEMVDPRANMEYQMKALASAIAEIDKVVLEEAKQTDIFSWKTKDNILEIGETNRNRTADAERVSKVLGEELFHKYGSQAISVVTLDKLLRGNEITPEQKVQLRGLITKPAGSAKVQVKPADPFEP